MAKKALVYTSTQLDLFADPVEAVAPVDQFQEWVDEIGQSSTFIRVERSEIETTLRRILEVRPDWYPKFGKVTDYLRSRVFDVVIGHGSLKSKPEDFAEPSDQNKNDSICKDWRSCQWGSACMDDQNINIDCVCFEDEPHRIPKKAFSRDELKVIAAGFNLVKYSREEKMVWWSELDPDNNYHHWVAAEPFPTYAAAERKLKALKDSGYIETGLAGRIIMTGWNRPGSLSEAGFEEMNKASALLDELNVRIREMFPGEI